LDGSIINKTLPSRLEWILQGVISLKFYYFTRISFPRLPFKIDISNETSNSNNYLGLFISLGVVVFICLMCSVCFYKCSRIIIENANRRLDQRRRFNMNLPSLNLMPNEEENIRRTNQETLNKLLETDLKPMKYNEGINHFHTNCTICLEDFNGSMEVIFLFCKHIFHFNCLKDWLDKNILMPKCPNCNYNVLTGGVIDLHPNQNNDNIINQNNNNGNLEVNFNNNQIIDIHRNPNNNNLNLNPRVDSARENNMIEIIQVNKVNQRNIDDPNYIVNKADEIELINIINTHLPSINKENENNHKSTRNHGYNRVNSNYNSNDNSNNKSPIQVDCQDMALNEIEDINYNQDEINRVKPETAEENREGFFKTPPPNSPSSQTQNKKHNNFIIANNQNINNGNKKINEKKSSILNNSKENILSEESKHNK